MNVFKYFRTEVTKIVEDLAAAGTLPAGLDLSRVAAEPPREAAHGDIATNAAMVLAKPASMKPRDLAALLVERLKAHPEVTAAEIAGPGFINLRLADRFWRARLADVLAAGLGYGDSELGQGRAVNVEYVSANPTGPLHVGHGRGAVFGDVLASLLEKVGFKVTREYYINDAGAQINALGRSVQWQARKKSGQDMGPMPEGLYPGEYLQVSASVVLNTLGLTITNQPDHEWAARTRDIVISEQMERIRDDLEALGVRHDVFSSERAMVAAGGVEAVLAFLESKGLVYVGTLDPPKGKTPEEWEPRPQTLFRATDFGDDVDRPLKKSDGSWTYFAGDIAYHFDKYRRGFDTMIDVLGADHFGYVKRMQAAVKALSEGKAELDVKICQLVNLLDRGEPVKMSKRSGTFVTLREVIDRVGKDVVRFIMLTRRNDQSLDFDFAKVQEKTRDNPVFYVQYAHARAHSVLRHGREAFPNLDLTPVALARGPLDRLSDPAELALIRSLAAWPRTVEGAAEAHEPHRLAFYLYELAAEFHALWNRGNEDATLRFLIPGDAGLSAARLALLSGMAGVIASGLKVFGVEPLEEMR